MQKLLTIAMALFMVSAVMAQDEQESKSSSGDSPSMWLGGEITFGSMSDLDFTFGPSFGLMLGERIGAGATLLFSSGNNANRWGLEPYIRYYIPVADQFSFYGDGFLGVGGGDNATDVDGGDYNTLDFGARIGLQYWFTPQWSLSASTDVLSYRSRNSNGEFGMGANFNMVNFAFFYHF